MTSQTTLKVLTARGPSAVAVLQVEGPDALPTVAARFQAASGKPLAKQPNDYIVFGRWLDANGDLGEELIVCQVSPTSIEVHCHGGQAAIAAVQASLVALGCAIEEHPKLDPASIRSEAQTALSSCATERAAAILLDQLNGAFQQAIESLCRQIAQGKHAKAKRKLEGLLDHAKVGRRLIDPWKVVLAGPPNVGKSSLINALVGYERAVVFDQPGVTRDVVTAAAAIDGWPVELSDTAGLRAATNALEKQGVELAQAAIDDADLVLLVESADAGRLEETPIKAPVLRVANKADLGSATSEDALPVSALTGEGITELVAAISQSLVAMPPPAGAAVPFNERHERLLRLARQAIEEDKPAAAKSALLSLLSD